MIMNTHVSCWYTLYAVLPASIFKINHGSFEQTEL